MAHLERAIFELWGDVTSTENRVPPPVTSCHLFGEPPSLPLWGDVIYGRSHSYARTYQILPPLVQNCSKWTRR